MKQFLRSLCTLLLLMLWCSVGFAQTTIWSEDWTGQEDKEPNKVSPMYSVTNSSIRNEKYAEGIAPELMIKTNGTWSVTISDLKGCNNSFTLSFKTNRHTTSKYISVTANGKTISCPQEGKTSTHSGKFELNVATGKNLVLIFKANGDNCRIDDIKLTGTPVESNPTLTFSETEKTVYKGAESEFTMPTLVLKDKDGKEVTSGVDYLYEVTDANPEGCLDVDMTTGKITFNKLGTANIKVTTSTTDTSSELNNLTASFKLTYMKDPAAKDNLFFAEAEKTVYVGKTDGFDGLSATQYDVKGAEVTPDYITYEATPTGVVDIDGTTGKIKNWLKTGTVIIKASSMYGDEIYEASYVLNYKKIATTLTLSKTSVTVNLGEAPELPTCTLKAGDEVLTKPLSYIISPEGIANINSSTGELTLISAGKATVCVSFDGDETYDASNMATYDLIVVDPNAPLGNIVFDAANKAFDKVSDSGYSSEPKNADFKTEDGKTYAFSYSNCMRFTNEGSNPDVIQMKKNAGTFKSPVFDEMLNGYKVNVYYGIYSNSTPLTITSNEETSATSINGDYGKRDNKNGTGYCTSIILSNGSSFTVNAGGSATYVSKIEIIPLPAPLTLSETDADTDSKIEKNNGKTLGVTLTRTLTANVWNTICLPFDVTAEQIEDVLKSAGNVKEFDREDANTPTIYFKDATTMTAGKPYLIKPTVAATELVFKGVTIKNVGESDRKFGSSYKICGTFGKYAMNTDGTELFLKTDGKFYVPAEGKETMKGFRAYFFVPKNTAGAALNLSFGEATGIDGVAVDAVKKVKVYNVNGQYVGTNLDALPKGLYIVGGKKVLK